MVRGGQNAVPDAAAAVAAYLGVRRQRQKASSLAMRRLQQSWFANQDNAVVQAMVLAAASCNNGDRRVVPRALGGWRGSTIAGYLTYDDIAYVANFRATDAFVFPGGGAIFAVEPVEPKASESASARIVESKRTIPIARHARLPQRDPHKTELRNPRASLERRRPGA